MKGMYGYNFFALLLGPCYILLYSIICLPYLLAPYLRDVPLPLFLALAVFTPIYFLALDLVAILFLKC
jgi:hypothetical protein